MTEKNIKNIHTNITPKHNQIQLSILIPSLPSRAKQFKRLYKKINAQIKDERTVEVLVFMDNKKRSIGHKRDGLVRLAKGRFLAFLDDDDDISDDYIETLLKAIKEAQNELRNIDIFSFDAFADIDGQTGTIEMSIENENDQFKPGEITKRKPFHVCAFRSELAKKVRFKDMMYGEDWHWCKEVLKDVKIEHRINKVLYYYTYRSTITEAY